jgi:hypothetical protein
MLSPGNPPGYVEFRLLPAEDAQAVVLVEVLVVLEVQGGERDAMGEAAGRNPHVVDRPRSSALDGYCGQSAPGDGYCLITGQHSDVGQPAGEFLAAVLAPVADLRPLGQLSEGHKGDERLAADQASGKRPGECSLVQQGGDIGIQDDWVHGWGSGQVAVTLGVGEGQELLQFLVGLEGIRGKLIERTDRP